MRRLATFSWLLLGPATPVLAQACDVDYPARTPSGAPSPSAYANQSRLSADGRWVAWSDVATDLVPGHPAGFSPDVFLRDRDLGTTVQISVGPNGEPADYFTLDLDMTADARWIALSTAASNIIPGDVNTQADVFLFDRQTGTREFVSVNSQGQQANGYAGAASISPDGRFVAFVSRATNLDQGDTDTVEDVYVRDRQLGTTRLASVDGNGVKGTGQAMNARISADGRYVAFLSVSTEWFPEVGSDQDVFRKDMLTGQLDLVSATPSGEPGSGLSVGDPWISPDGRWVGFNSRAGDLGPPNSAGTTEVFLRDMQAGITQLLSSDSNDQPVQGHSTLIGITPDLRRVAFGSTAHGLAPNENAFYQQVYVKDLVTRFVTRASASATGEAANYHCEPIGAFSDDGSCVTFLTSATNLVPGVAPNGYGCFVRDCPPDAGTALCFGDGSGTACPCGNSGTLGHGCANPIHPEGAQLTAFGMPSVANDTLVLAGDFTTNSIVTYFQGTGASAGGNGVVFGDGLVCANGAVIRLGTRPAVSGTSQYPGPSDQPVSQRGQIPAGGGVRVYQIWYRIAANYCTPATYSFSNAYQIAWSF